MADLMLCSAFYRIIVRTSGTVGDKYSLQGVFKSEETSLHQSLAWRGGGLVFGFTPPKCQNNLVQFLGNKLVVKF